MRRIIGMIMPLEWILLVCGALTLLLYKLFGIPLPGAPGPEASQGPLPFYLKQILTALDVYCLVVLAFVAWQIVRFWKQNGFRWRELARGSFWRHLVTRFYEVQIIQDVRFLNALLVMFMEFGLLKNLIPLMNSSLYDDWFIAADRLLCAGVSCSEYLHSTLGRSSGSLQFISSHYLWYYPYMSLVAFLFIVWTPRKLAHEYLCAFVTLFLLGTLVIYLIPTWGPVYYTPASFEFMKGTPISDLQHSLWQMKEMLELDRSDPRAIFMISGFPSLHIAVVTLGSIYLGRIHRVLAWISWAFCLLTLNSTIYLGWHYLLDDVGAVLLVWIAWLIGRWCTHRWTGYVDYVPYNDNGP
jgi:membrane-associated phospholipid phosphatase